MDWNFLIRNKQSITVSTDTRNLLPGCVFFALKGQNFNGNKFAAMALQNGAEYVVVDEDVPADLPADKVIRVENTLLALQDLAKAWRKQWGKTVIAITGTNGKTTTKELTAAVLATKYNVHFTQGNLNNQIGVPLTLLQLKAEHEIAIVEMGASHPGDIKELVDIACPDCGIITNVGKAHLQGFLSFDGVMQTKAELYDYLHANNKFCFRNTDNNYLAQMAGTLKTVPYTTGTMPEGTHLVGAYNAENISAAICIGSYFGVDAQVALNAIRAYVPDNNRSQLIESETNTLVVDAYNANPTSMKTAVLSFITKPVNNKKQMFILGDMLELGEYSQLEHQNIVNILLEQKATDVLLVGQEFAKTTAPFKMFDNVETLKDYLNDNKPINCQILVKASHGIHLEKIIELL